MSLQSIDSWGLRRRQIATALLTIYCANPLLATAQVVINAGTPNDGRRPYVDQTQNGLPKVNIATPNGAGVSHNIYTEFNIGKQGLILNNSATNSNTQLAGWVEGNPNLGIGREALLILNEVIGAKASQLNGFLEVAGKKADVVVANENGVTCNGCGFINTDRTVLTTGKPMFGADGRLDYLAVRRGAVTIGPDGLSAPDSRVDLLSLAINVQGKINADRLNLVAGSNDVAYDTLSHTAVAGATGSIDVALLGGMYANQIDLVATGAGVGVRIDGTLVSAGNVHLSSDGFLTHSGKTSAQGEIRVSTPSLENSGDVVATGALSIAGGETTNRGTLEGHAVTVTQSGRFSNEAAGKLGVNAELTLKASTISNAGQISSRGDARFTADQITNNGTLNSQGTWRVDQATQLENSGTVTAKGLDVSAERVINLGAGVIAIDGTGSLQVTTLNNLGRLHFTGLADFDVRRLNNPGILEVNGGLKARDLWLFDNSGTLAGSLMEIGVQTLVNSGRIEAEQLKIAAYSSPSIPDADRQTATDLDNSGLIAANRLALTGFGRIRNRNQISTDVGWTGTQADSSKLELEAETLDNTGGRILAKANLVTSVTDFVNRQGSLGSSGDQSIAVSRDLDNASGLILHQGTGTANITVGRALNNAAGQIEGQGSRLTVNAGDLDNSDGQILQTSPRDPQTAPSMLKVNVAANPAVAGTAGQLRNIKGKIAGTGNVSVVADALITDASDPRLSSGSSLTLLDKAGAASGGTTSGGAYDWEGDIAKATAVANAKASADQAATTAQQAAANLQSANTALSSAQAAKQSTATQLQNAQQVKATADANVTTSAAAAAADPTNTPKAQALSTAQTAATTAAQNLTTATNADTAAATAVLQAQVDVASTTTANQVAQATKASADQAYATAQAAVTPVSSGTTGNAPAQPGTNPTDLTVPTPPQITLDIPESRLEAGYDLTVKMGSGTLDNRKGRFAAVHDLTVEAQGDLLAGQMTAGNALSVSGRQVEVAQQLQAKSTTVTADTLINSGRIQGNGSLTVHADSLSNSGTLTGNRTALSGKTSATALKLHNTGLIQGNDSLSFEAGTVLNEGTLATAGNLTLSAAQALENTALVYSAGNQSLSGADIVNNQGRFYALGDILIRGMNGGWADSILNYAGRIEAQGHIELIAHSVINRAILPSVNIRGVVTKTDDGMNIRSIAQDTFNADGKNAEILAGKTLKIEAGTLTNDYGILSARLSAALKATTLTNRSYGAIQTENLVVRAACFNCHQTVKYHDSWGGVIESGGAVTINAATVNNLTTDTRDGFAGLSTDPRVVKVDERAGTQSPLTKAFVERFGIVNGPANSSAGSGPTVNLGSPRRLSDNLILTADGQFDFSRFTLPDGKTGLFEKADPASPYLIRGRSDLYVRATDGQYITYDKFVGSDYLLTRLGLMPVGLKRLGDAWYETQLVQEQLYALTGRKYLIAGTDTDYDLMRGLMDAGLLAATQFGLAAGDSLTPEQQAALNEPIVWPEWQEVDGQRVLVPKVYLAHQGKDLPTPKGALIAGSDVAITTRELKNGGVLEAGEALSINASGTVSGGGSYRGGKSVALVAKSVDLDSARIDSGGWLNLSTTDDLTLTATQIKAKGDAVLSAGGDLNLQAKLYETHVVRGDGTTKDEVRYETSNIEAGGTLALSAKRNLSLEGSEVKAGNNLELKAENGQVELKALKETMDYTYYGEGGLKDPAANSGRRRADIPDMLGSKHEGPVDAGKTTVHEETLKGVRFQSGGSTTIKAGTDISATALGVQTGGDASLQAGGKVSLADGQTSQRKETRQTVNELVSRTDGEGNAVSELTPSEKVTQTASTERLRSTINAGGNVDIQAKQADLAGSYQARQDVTVSAETTRVDGQFSAGRDIGLAGSTLLQSAPGTRIDAGRDAKLAGGGLLLDQTQVTTGRDAALNATGTLGMTNSTLQAAGNAELNAGGQVLIQGQNGAKAQVAAGGNLAIVGLDGVTAQAIDIKAGQDLSVASLGDVTVLGTSKTEGGGNHIRTTTEKSTLAGQNVTISTLGMGNVTLQASDVGAQEKAKINAGGDVIIASGENYSFDQWTTSSTSGPWYNKKTTVTNHLRESTVQVPTIISGGSGVDVAAGNDLTTLASRIESGGDVTLTAGNKIDYLAALNVNRSEEQSKTKRNLGGLGLDLIPFGGLLNLKSSSTDIKTETHAAPTQLQSEADILSQSGGDTRLQGTQVKAGGSFTAEAGVGPKADSNAKILIEGVKKTVQTIHTEKSESLLWQQQAGNGSTSESLALAKIEAQGGAKFSAPGGITVQLPESDNFRQQIESLSKQPGTEWLGELANRKDVDWEKVKLAFETWDYKHEGLTQAAAIIIAIIVTILLEDWSGQTAAGIVGASEGFAYAATQAAILATASTAAVSVINNKGDLGKVLKEMGSDETLKNIAISALTAGALENINPGWKKTLASNTTGITEKAVINLTNAAVGATIKTAIAGGSYADNLKTSLLNAGVDTAVGWVANQIGDTYKSDTGLLKDQYLAHKVAHALLGCAGAEAKGQDCAAGAIGGAVGEAFAEMYGGTNDGSQLDPEKQQQVLAVSKMVAAAVAGLAGTDAQAAVDAAQLAVVNNYLSPKQLMQVEQALAACKGDGLCEARVRDSARVLSATQDIGLTAAKTLSLLGFPDAYDKKIEAINQAYDPVQTVLDVKAMHPDWSDAQVQAKATQYLTEAQSSLDASTWRTVFGTLDAVGAASTAIGVLRVGSQAVGATVRQADTGITWNGGIQNQGLPWEDFLAKQLPAESRLPANFKTFDFYDELTKTAISAKTLDTTTVAKIANPSQVYSSLRNNIDDVVRFETYTLSGEVLNSGKIQARELQVAIPQGTTSAQWEQINRAILYGQSKGVNVKITTVKP